MSDKYPGKILFLSSFDPADRKKLSGVSYFIYDTLIKDFETVDVLGPVQIRGFLNSIIGRIVRKLPVRYNLEHSYFLAYLYARAFRKLLNSHSCDIILAPRASSEIALLRTSIPIFYYTDTTFHSLYNYYEWFSGFSALSVWEGNRIEKKALDNASACIFTSEWAAKSALNFYKIPQNKVHIIPWGPNLESIPLRDEVLAQRQTDTCNLLFLGVEWQRKGGEIAFNAFRHLKNRGYKVKLTICGCIPPEQFQDNDMTVIPFINKNKPEAKQQFHQLMLSHHFLVLPTRAECYGVVFVEASAYGMPSVTTDTGGIGAVVHNNVNGSRLPLSAGPEEYANFIEQVFYTENRYQSMSLATRDFFEQELHWDNFSRKLNLLIDSVKNST
jgi:glycosyltransferase involved in cell wall biosynthesis